MAPSDDGEFMHASQVIPANAAGAPNPDRYRELTCPNLSFAAFSAAKPGGAPAGDVHVAGVVHSHL